MHKRCVLLQHHIETIPTYSRSQIEVGEKVIPDILNKHIVIDKVWVVNAMTITFLNGIFVADMQERFQHYISICNVCGSADWWPVHSL